MKRLILIIIALNFAIAAIAQDETVNGNLKVTGKVGIGIDSPSTNLEIYDRHPSLKFKTWNEGYDFQIKVNLNYQNRFSFISGNRIFLQEKTLSTLDGDSYSKVLMSNYGGIGFGTSISSDFTNESQLDFYISKSGKIGVGTTGFNAQAKLQVKGNTFVENGGINFITSSSDASGTTGIKANPNGWTRLDPNGSRFLIPVKNTDVTAKRNILDIENTEDEWKHLMELHADGGGFFMGKIGIGVSNPGVYKLAVNGSVKATEIKVKAAPWSDFVFYKDYKLPTLAEVEQHIKEKGHLQDIPSAKEVEKNGIFLGEMNAKLLQKIEELTLYTIQQEKKIARQQKEFEELKNRFVALEKLLKNKD